MHHQGLHLGLLIFSLELLLLQLLLLAEFLDFQIPVIFFSICLASAISSAILILSSSALFSLDDLLLALLLDLPDDLLSEEAFVDTDCLELSCACLSASASFI